MVQQQTAKAPKVVRVIEPTISVQETVNSTYRAIRVAAYCRVSTKQEEQLNSYENQVKHYTERINAEPGWILEGIYADKGITGTSYKKRDEFNRMIRRCKQGKIDMIIVKSIARFARNTVDCLKFVRMLRDLDVDVYFEEQGIHSNQPGAEFYITIYGCIAQSESENISANVRWGKAQSAKEGNVPFHYKNFLGYRKGADGKPEIDPDEAEIVRFIYDRFLAGDSLGGIAQKLEDLQIPSPSGKPKWQFSTIQSILTNEKYKGDAIINKTYIKDCISKKVMINNGDRPKYYVENNHPAIIDSLTFSRVQEEIARRNSKKKVKQKGSKTEQGRYSSKYALTELLVCGECKTPYRRCTWTISGQKKIVWRCISRLDFGKKYCHNSPSIEESLLHRAIMRAIMDTALKNSDVLKMLKLHIGMGFEENTTEDNALNIQVRIAEIDAEFKAMLSGVSSDTVDAFDDEKASALIMEKTELQKQLEQLQEIQQKRINTKHRLDDIYTILDGLKNRPMEYDDQMVRQILECVTVDSKEQITVIFIGGLKIKQSLLDC
ncbi:MAG: recombinase family protein [Clostridia bacterium]|jgi:DNA invertase Pin-like site-specific DNA recombinase|nr:recombinase family protein [Clostridia bacterium]